MLNKVQIIGRLGKDPEVKTLENGNAVANFSVACSEKYKDKSTGETKETTEWVNIVVWDNQFSKLATNVIAKYVHKGDRIYVEGKLKTRTWEKEGITRYTTEVIVNNVILLESVKSNNGGGEYRGDDVQKQYNDRGNKPSGNTFTGGTDATDDLPF